MSFRFQLNFGWDNSDLKIQVAAVAARAIAGLNAGGRDRGAIVEEAVRNAHDAFLANARFSGAPVTL